MAKNNDLRFENLTFLSSGPYALRVSAGEIVFVSGLSGAGKTMLLRSVADLDPHGGEAWLGDVACQSVSAPEWRRMVGFLPAESAWWDDVVAAHYQAPDKVPFEKLGFASEVSDWPVSRLSTGERQRLALLRLLENEPSALLLDEPTANLDAASVELVIELIDDYRRDHDAPVIWVSHDEALPLRLGGRKFVLEHKGLREMA